MNFPTSLIILACALAPFARADDKPAAVEHPTLFIVGDSTVKNGSGKGDGGLWGWGDPIAEHFDASKIAIRNLARGGRSSRTYQTEGLWDQAIADMKPGDFVLMQFGHNDGGPVDTGRARASLRGVGDESKEVELEATKKKETVRTYGWYMRKYVADAKAKGVTPIVLSPVPRNIWKDGKVARASADYGKWAAEIARAEHVPFVDLNEIVAAKYEAAGEPKVAAEYFTPADHTHTTVAGAKLNAASVVEGLKAVKDLAMANYLTEK